MKGVIDMKKMYKVYVLEEHDGYFSSMLQKRSIEVINRIFVINENNPMYCYVLKAEEGIIDPKFEMES